MGNMARTTRRVYDGVTVLLFVLLIHCVGRSKACSRKTNVLGFKTGGVYTRVLLIA